MSSYNDYIVIFVINNCQIIILPQIIGNIMLLTLFIKCVIWFIEHSIWSINWCLDLFPIRSDFKTMYGSFISPTPGQKKRKDKKKRWEEPRNKMACFFFRPLVGHLYLWCSGQGYYRKTCFYDQKKRFGRAHRLPNTSKHQRVVRWFNKVDVENPHKL